MFPYMGSRFTRCNIRESYKYFYVVLLKASGSGEMEERTDLGLVKGHAYGITAIKRIPLGDTSLVTLFKYVSLF
jgi:hypothetical protein